MPRRRLPSLVLVALSLPLCLAGPAAPARAAAAEPWTEVKHPRPGGADTGLFDVVSPAPGVVWAVGRTTAFFGGTSETRTFGQHCVDGVCTRANLPTREAAPALDYLYGISAASPSEIWTVGVSAPTGDPVLTLAIRYDGTTWRIVDTPNPSNSYYHYLSAVAAISPTAAVAVGSFYDTAAFEPRPLVMRWNGSTWRLTTFPAVPGCTARADLSDVVADGSTVYVVGTCRTPAATDEGFVVSLTSAGWQVQVRPGDGVLPTPSTLRSVAAVPGGGVFAVGTSAVPGQFGSSGVATRYDGQRWTRLPVPQLGGTVDLFAVAGRSPSDIWIVGSTTSPQIGGVLRLTLNWNGTRLVPVPAGQFGRLSGVAYDPAGFWWSVGVDSSTSLVLRRPVGA